MRPENDTCAPTLAPPSRKKTAERGRTHIKTTAILVLQTEEQIASQRERRHRIDPSQVVDIFPRREKYKGNDRAIQSLVQAFAAKREPSDEDFETLLSGVAYRLARNDYNQWGSELVEDSADDSVVVSP